MEEKREEEKKKAGEETGGRRREKEKEAKRTGEGKEMRIHWRRRTSLELTTTTFDAMTDHER